MTIIHGDDYIDTGTFLSVRLQCSDNCTHFYTIYHIIVLIGKLYLSIKHNYTNSYTAMKKTSLRLSYLNKKINNHEHAVI